MEKLLLEADFGLKVSQIDASHAFYLGHELCKASIALLLGKQYNQDESLDWGYLTVPENFHRLRASRNSSGVGSEDG
jgi:hypothetical protein